MCSPYIANEPTSAEAPSPFRLGPVTDVAEVSLSWNATDRGVFVEHGCRADFEVTY